MSASRDGRRVSAGWRRASSTARPEQSPEGRAARRAGAVSRRVRSFGFLFLDARCLTDLFAQVVQAVARDDAALTDLDALDARAVQQKRLLDADAVRDSAHRDRLSGAAALAHDYHAFEHLRAFFAALNDFGIDFDRIARAKLRDGILELVSVQGIDHIHGSGFLTRNSRATKSRA